MHLPAAVRRRILYATAAVLVTGGLVVSAQPVPNAAASVVPEFDGPAAAERIANEYDVTPVAPAAQSSAPAAKSTTATATQAARPKFTTYTVVAGDTAGTIAEKFGLKTATVLSANDMDEEDTLKIGQELTIPSTDGAVVKIRSGDTLYDLADAYGVHMDEIIRANPDVDPDALKIDQVLILPGASTSTRRQVASARGSVNRPNVSKKFDYWPAVGVLTDFFGWRVHPVYGTENYHDGMDIGVPKGTPVRAAAAGTVIMASWYGGYGNAIKIDHGGGVVTLYAHLSSIGVEVGQKVAAGANIGYSGNTGTSTGPHLHFTVMVGGSPVDPQSWLP